MTIVIDQEGTKKVAQYGQWDGYPSGVGSDILEFLKNKELLEQFKKHLPRVRFAAPEGRDKEFLEAYDKANEDTRTPEQKNWFDTYCTRDLAAEVLTNIANSEDEEILLLDRTNTATTDGWVEYSYIINFQENTLAVHGHVDTPPFKVYSLDELPEESDFIRELEAAEEEAE